jgi:hypothetical protein
VGGGGGDDAGDVSEVDPEGENAGMTEVHIG